MDFRNTVIVMTSSLGWRVIQEMAGNGDEAQAYTQMNAGVMAVMQAHFRARYARTSSANASRPEGVVPVWRIRLHCAGEIRHRCTSGDGDHGAPPPAWASHPAARSVR